MHVACNGDGTRGRSCKVSFRTSHRGSFGVSSARLRSWQEGYMDDKIGKWLAAWATNTGLRRIAQDCAGLRRIATG